MTKKHLVYVSSSGANKLQPMLEALQEHEGLTVTTVHLREHANTYYNDSRTLLEKAAEKLRVPLDPERQNDRLLSVIKQERPDYVLIVKGNYIRPSTLARARTISPLVKLVNWTQDNMTLTHNRSIWFELGARHYDLVCASRNYVSSDWRSLGVQKVLFQDKSFLPRIHRPLIVPHSTLAHDVVFVGSAEHQRFEMMNDAARRGHTIHIYGSGWDRLDYAKRSHSNLHFHFENLLAERYAEAISNAKIALCFLRHLNGDKQTSRTVEIPACGAFMLAEYSADQAMLFTPGKEADYFSSGAELAAKLSHYLSKPDVRRDIADAGHMRCVQSGYRFQDRCNAIIDAIERL